MTTTIGFDGRDLLRKRTGVVNYTVQLARYLSKRKGVKLQVYADAFVDPDVTPPEDVPLKRLSAPGVFWKHAALPLALIADGATLFHSPTGTLPYWAPCKQVVTIHDLYAEVGPEWFSSTARTTLASGQRRAANAAKAIIAVSENTKRDIVERYGVPPERVHVVHNGVDHSIYRPAPADADLDAVAKRYGVKRPFILCVGSLLPWRNAPRLLQAVAQLRERGARHELLFVGRDIWGTDPTQKLAEENGWTWARFAGYVQDEDLPLLYAAADVFAYPSLYEGFGIPPLEAMATGTPVLASRAGAIPEVLGGAAVLVDPYEVASITTGLERILSDSDLRKQLSLWGLGQARRYTWERAAEQTWKVYEKV